MSRISIIGSGWVGVIVGEGFAELGNDVIFYNRSEDRLMELKESGYKTTNDIDYAIKSSDISFVTVATPTTEGKIDLTAVKEVSKKIGESLLKKNTYHTIVVKSTVVPGTTENIIKPVIESASGKTCGVGFGLSMNPEFLTQIHNTWTDDDSFKRDFFQEDKIVIGEFDKESGDVVEELYKSLKIPIFRTDIKTAEMIKYAANCCLAAKISYWNQIFYICQKLGIDSDLVAKIVSMDKRVGKYGTVHGKAFGGSCFPKDLDAFIRFSEEHGCDATFLKAIKHINEKIKKDRGVRE